MKITKISKIDYSGRIYTPEVKDNWNYLFANGCLSKNCQGQSKASLQKMLTRIGKDCKVIIIGSQRQIDNQYVTKFNNGLSVLMNEATKPQPLIHLHAVNLSKVIRSNMAEWAENIFSKDLLT